MPTREQFLRDLRKEGRKKGFDVFIDYGQGKGSHAKIRIGDRRTVLKDGELSPGYIASVRKQLGLPN